MNYGFIALLATLGVLIAILGMLELGRRIGVRRMAEHGDNAVAGVSAIEGAVFPRIGLMRLDSYDYVLVDARSAMK